MNKVTFAASSIMNQKSSTASQIAVVHLSGSSNPSATNNGSGLKTNSSSATTTIGNGAINYNNHGSAAAAAATTTSISTGAASAANSSSTIVGFKGGNSGNRGPGIPPKPSLINGYRNGFPSADQSVKSVSIKVNTLSGQSKQHDSQTTTASDKSTDSDSPVPPDARAKQVLKEAVNAVVNSFAKHSTQGGYGRGELISPIILIRGQ